MNMEITLLPLAEIEVPADRLRDADPDRVDEMVISLRERGQLQAIEVLPKNASGKYPLNIGLHRLLAAEKAGLTELRATVFDGGPLEARLREIDENLYRAELNPLDQAVFLAERRAIFEQLHGKVRANRPKKTPANLRQLSFFDDTTKAFGLSRPTIERALTRFTRLTPEVRRALRGTSTARIASEVDALAKLDPEEQLKVVGLLVRDSSIKKVAGAVAKLHGGRAPTVRAHKSALERLMDLWKKAPEEDRSVFIRFLRSNGHLRNPTKARPRKGS